MVNLISLKHKQILKIVWTFLTNAKQLSLIKQHN